MPISITCPSKRALASPSPLPGDGQTSSSMKLETRFHPQPQCRSAICLGQRKLADSRDTLPSSNWTCEQMLLLGIALGFPESRLPFLPIRSIPLPCSEYPQFFPHLRRLDTFDAIFVQPLLVQLCPWNPVALWCIHCV